LAFISYTVGARPSPAFTPANAGEFIALLDRLLDERD
jgi:hypothetical protein